MRICFVQLSDIHFGGSSDWVFSKARHIASAASACGHNIEAFVLIFSGDITFSGQAEQFLCAKQFLNNLRQELVTHQNNCPAVFAVFVPGNHDCDFLKTSDIRAFALQDVGKLIHGEISGKLAAECAGVQDEFFTFESSESNYFKESRLFARSHIDVGGYSIAFALFNSAWLSQLNEKQGGLVILTESIAKLRPLSEHADLRVSVFHHPYNWCESNNARDFKTLVESSSDFAFTGHEHISQAFQRDVFGSAPVVYFEGAVLQEAGREIHEFNLVLFDTESRTFQTFLSSWKSGMFITEELGGQRSLPSARVRSEQSLQFGSDFSQELNDMGTGFTHPRVKNELRLDQIFVFPDLDPRMSHSHSSVLNKVKGEDVINTILRERHVIISGSDLSGKSALSRMLCIHLVERGLSPVLLIGRDLTATNASEADRALRSHVERQYTRKFAPTFAQLSSSSKVLIIDDFSASKLSPAGQVRLIKLLKPSFDHIVLFVHQMFPLEQASLEDHERLANFAIFEIAEFGHFLRSKLIRNWVRIGRELGKRECDELVASHERIINAVMGRNLLPSNPLTILVLIQAYQTSSGQDSSIGSYGYLYEALILQALSTIGFSSAERDSLMKFLSMLAYDSFRAEREEFSDRDFDRVCDLYTKQYGMRIRASAMEALTSARVLQNNGSNLRFRYSYCRYYFVARYLEDQIRESETVYPLRVEIRDLIEHIHHEECNHILTFYVYFSRDTVAINSIIESSKEILSEFTQCDFDRDVEFFNKLYVTFGDRAVIALPKTTPEANRDEFRKGLDAGPKDDEPEGQLQEKIKYSRELSIFLRIAIAFKMLNVLGQILRNSPGSLRAELKNKIAEEAYSLGLRTLKAVLSFPEDHLDSMRTYFAEILRDRRAMNNFPTLSEVDVLKRADESILKLAQAFSFGMIRRISQAVGMRELADTYLAVQAGASDSISLKLIDLCIRLDHFEGAPETDIAKLHHELRDNKYGKNTLSDLVACFLYLRDTDYKVRQRLMSRFKFQGYSPKLIENPNKRKDR